MAQSFDTSTVPEFKRRKAKYLPIAAALGEVYGFPAWRQWLPPLDELVSCILSQSTTDTNRDRAFDALKARYKTYEEVRDAPTEDVIEAIKVAGLGNQKAPRIQEVLRRIYDERGAMSIDFLRDLPMDEAKAWLTSLNGVGPKTAAIVLCFGFNRPAFPVDTHVHRVGQRIGFLPQGISADKAHPLMEAIVPPEDHLAFHLNLIRHGREICTARVAHCERCPLTEWCDHYGDFNHRDTEKKTKN
jgi:endonuclease III